MPKGSSVGDGQAAVAADPYTIKVGKFQLASHTDEGIAGLEGTVNTA